MLVILRENVDHLGRTGDVVRVSPGYARNFLLPRSLVVAANENNLKELEHHKKVLEKKRSAQKATADEYAQKLSQITVTFKRKAGKNDKLFGSVSSQEIADELAKQGFQVEKSLIQLKETIKLLGVHPVTIKLQPEVVATVKVWIVKEEG